MSHSITPSSQVVEGVYVTTGHLTLPHSQVAIAYKLWSNRPNETTPVQARTLDPQSHVDSRLNILALHGRHDNSSSYDHPSLASCKHSIEVLRLCHRSSTCCVWIYLAMASAPGIPSTPRIS